MAGRIGSRAVYFRRVLARESATAMGTLASVGVNDNLTSSQSGVTVRSANNELSSRIDIILDVIAKEVEHLLGMDF